MESLGVQFWAHFSFWYKLMICQIASNTSHLECLLTILTEQPTGKALIKSNWGLMKTQVILDYSYKQISSAITLRRQNICSLLHDWLAKLSLEPNVCIGRDPIKRVKYTKIPGVYIDEPLTWSKHAEEMTKRLPQELVLQNGSDVLQVEMYLFQFIMH